MITPAKLESTPNGRVILTDAAKYLGAAPRTVRNWKHQGLAPRSIRLGGRVFFYLTDVQSFVSGKEAN